MGNSMQIIVKKLQLSNSSNLKVMELSPPKECHELANFTCEICVENILFPDQKFKNRDICTHPFCNDCIINYVKVKIEVDNAEKIKCPGLCCDFNLDILSCRSILPVKLFEKWCDILFEKAILGLGHCYCPNRKCSTLIVNECGGDVKRSVCHNCKQAFCFKCKTSWHAGYDCEETEQIKDSNDIAFGVLVEKNKWTRCPKCKFYISINITDCRKYVFCRCRTKFCYNCGKKFIKTFCECSYSQSPNRLIRHLGSYQKFWLAFGAILNFCGVLLSLSLSFIFLSIIPGPDSLPMGLLLIVSWVVSILFCCFYSILRIDEAVLVVNHR